jgi:hypothetical protein
MSRAELLLEALGEGGSLAIYGRHDGDRTLYQVGIVDQTPTFLNDDKTGEEIGLDSEWLDAWGKVVATIGHCAWPSLHPKFVHPSIREAIWKAAQDYRDYAARQVREEALRRWQSKCSDVESAISR